MHRKRRFALLGILALALSVTVGLAAGAAEAKKKKRKAGGTADITQVVNGAIPDGTATSDGVLQSTIAVGGKKFKGTRVRDVNVTFTTLGATPIAAGDLVAFLTAPDGATSFLEGGFGGMNIGPVTFDDESNRIVVGGTTARSSFELPQPYVGTVHPDGPPLAVMDNGPASGTWTLTVLDTAAVDTSTLSSWRLTVVAGKPFKTK
jgi:subtilisin-like proprotein convertase family protein